MVSNAIAQTRLAQVVEHLSYPFSEVSLQRGVPIAAVEMAETESYVRTRAERGFSHNLCPNQPLGCYIAVAKTAKTETVLWVR